MTPGGEALEWALALQRAPSRRAVVRVQPLPADITELLSIAGGSVASLESAARRVGSTEPKVLDAARFFVQQAMLFDGADAYRVLGVPRNASGALIRDHHRLLLKWLHPDHSGSGPQWDSAFSGRVNWAWNLVRTDALRATYDATLGDPAPAAPAFAATPAQLAPHAGQGRLAGLHNDPAPGGRVPPLAVVIVALACIALAWLVVRREGELDRLRDADLPSSASLDAAGRRATARTAPAPQGLEAVQRAAAALALAAPSGEWARPAAQPPRAEAVAPIAVGEPVLEAPVVPTYPEGNAEDVIVDASRRNVAAIAGIAGIASMPSSASNASIATGASVDPPLPRTPQPQSRRTANAPLPLAWASPAGPTVPAVAAVSATTVAPIAVADPVRPAPAEPARPAPAEASDPLRLMQQAQARVRGVTRYLVAGTAAPTWADASAQGAGESARDGLRSRLDGQPARELALETPHWRLDTADAAVRSRYSVTGPDGALEQGELTIDLLRRDGQWQVSTVRLVPGP